MFLCISYECIIPSAYRVMYAIPVSYTHLNYGNTIKGFEREDYSCKDWDDIRVPAHIQMEGYDAPQYANVQLSLIHI